MLNRQKTKPKPAWTVLDVDAIFAVKEPTEIKPKGKAAHNALPGQVLADPDAIHGAMMIDAKRLVMPERAPRHDEDAEQREMNESVQELSKRGEGIEGSGVLQPLLVRVHPRLKERYLIIAGARRWRAALAAGVRLPCLVRDMSDGAAFETGLIENVQRKDMLPAQLNESYQWLLKERGYSLRELARRIGKSAGEISKNLRVHDDPAMKRFIENGGITYADAQEMIVLEEADRARLAKAIAAQRAKGETVTQKDVREQVKETQARKEYSAGASVEASAVSSRNTNEAKPKLAIVPDILPHNDLHTADFHITRATATLGKLHDPQQYYHKELRKTVAALRARLDEIERIGTGAATEDVAA